MPMSQPVFDSYDEVKIYCKRIAQVMRCYSILLHEWQNELLPSNTLVLFQYGEELVGYAVHLDTVELDVNH